MPALAQLAHDVVAPACLDLDLPRLALAWIERAREVVGVEVGRVDRRLQIEPAVDVLQERVQRPLVLVVAARRAEREIGIAAPERERRR